MTIKFLDPTLAETELFSESGPCRCADGEYGYSIFVSPHALHTEVIISESELRAMLRAIENQYC